MKVVTPGSVAKSTGSKYLGVLVAAKLARNMNEFRRGRIEEEPEETARQREKLTTIALRSVARGDAQFYLTDRRPAELL